MSETAKRIVAAMYDARVGRPADVYERQLELAEAALAPLLAVEAAAINFIELRAAPEADCGTAIVELRRAVRAIPKPAPQKAELVCEKCGGAGLFWGSDYRGNRCNQICKCIDAKLDALKAAVEQLQKAVCLHADVRNCGDWTPLP